LSPAVIIGMSLVPFAAALAIAIIGRPTLNSLRLLVMVIPLQAFGAIEAGFTIPWSYLVLLFILIGVALKGEYITTRFPGGRLVLLYWTIALIATVAGYLFVQNISVNLSDTMRYRAGPLRSPIQYALLIFHFSLFFLVVNYVRYRDDADKILRTHLWVGFAIICLGIGQMAAHLLKFPLQDITWSIELVPNSSTYHYSQARMYSAGVADFATRATFLESLHLADYLNSVVPIIITLWISGSREIRRQFGLLASPWAAIAGLIALLFTMSRSGWGALVVSLIVLAICLSPRLVFIHLPIATAATSLVAAVMVKLGFFASSATSLWAVVTGRFDLEKIVMGPRAQYFLVLWESFQNNPILGLGAGRFAVTAPAMTGSDAVHSAHGLLWAALADFGLLGFLALATLFGFVLVSLVKAFRRLPKKSPQQVVMIGIFASLCALMFQSLFVHDRPQFYLILLLGLAVVYSKQVICGGDSLSKDANEKNIIGQNDYQGH